MFNKKYDCNLTKTDLIELLEVATKNQLFWFEGNLCEHVNGVAMGSPFGPLMANAFICNPKNNWQTKTRCLLSTTAGYVDDTLKKMRDVSSASEVLSTLNEIHPSLSFTMGLEDNGRLLFLGMVIIKKWSPTRHKDVRETNQYWSFTALPKPCWCEVQAFSAEHDVRPCIQTLFELSVFPSRMWTS